MRGVRIKQAHPEFAVDLLNLTKQFSKGRSSRRVKRLTRSCLLPPQIHPVIRRILADQIDFADAFTDESPNFRKNRLGRPATVSSPHLRNHAKTAWMIAAFGNLYVSGMCWGKPEARCVVIGNVSWPLCNKVVDSIGVADALMLVSNQPGSPIPATTRSMISPS